MRTRKSRGKGRYEVFEPAMHVAAVKRLELEVDLKQALERGEFVLHYQPVCRLANCEIVGVEALARWNHPTRGLLEPEEFIPLAEESHQVLPLGRWVLDLAVSLGLSVVAEGWRVRSSVTDWWRWAATTARDSSLPPRCRPPSSTHC